ncbi:hypothetical protein [Pimelobacter simplex]|uniref:hypothetical protein n=1 Tax=Nocardioides simplex TaxID=2045 RepID=UPI00214FA4B9|nr:hypothetical protein [Pimelobacter simplex]UUW92254.1 hypothetical protein M0M43_12460 [Pimelobacter simplex]UUW96081.1 hypothetical protein M0M48_01090 [Pimelobacter simplex]
MQSPGDFFQTLDEPLILAEEIYDRAIRTLTEAGLVPVLLEHHIGIQGERASRWVARDATTGEELDSYARWSHFARNRDDCWIVVELEQDPAGSPFDDAWL